MKPSVWAVVVAGGSGSRFGGAKQFEQVAGRRLVDWSLSAARGVSAGVVLVVPALCLGESFDGADVVVAGGATRAESVRAGLEAVPAEASVVVVHDAARPLASQALFESVVAMVLAGADGAIPGIPVADTVKRVTVSGDATVVVETLRRDELVAVQTPQAFAAAVLRRAHANRAEATDDAALVEAAGGRVVVVDGDARNLKVTSPPDLVAVEAALRSVQTRR